MKISNEMVERIGEIANPDKSKSFTDGVMIGVVTAMYAAAHAFNEGIFPDFFEETVEFKKNEALLVGNIYRQLSDEGFC